MRYLFILVILLSLSAGCTWFDNHKEHPKIQSKTITIRIIDQPNNKNRYMLYISTNGKQNEETAVFPQVKTVITNDQNEVKTTVALDVKYTIEAYQITTDIPETIYKLPKKTGKISKNDPTTIKKPLAEVTLNPSRNINIFNIKVNSK